MQKEINHSVQLSKKLKELIEKLEVVNEKQGMTPASAKIGALLTVCNEGELTFDQIRSTLNLSKSATSNGINLLLNTKSIEQINKFGERKRYFRVNLYTWKENLQEINKGYGYLATLLREVHKYRSKETVEFNTNLLEMVEFAEYLHEEMPKLYERWEKLKK
ncbi:GbsR/MarR family transcriptional regulator [Crocinitomix catalasitica]|uniref:GbsR/MarR family transcriptional regulator n=1 Tax=Crocinitomix catalasitica TaxID=184607 RepID=UPI00048854D2|nr:MarR family transcriptional regulator [Crocinitomix catalasitica]